MTPQIGKSRNPTRRRKPVRLRGRNRSSSRWNRLPRAQLRVCTRGVMRSTVRFTDKSMRFRFVKYDSHWNVVVLLLLHPHPPGQLGLIAERTGERVHTPTHVDALKGKSEPAFVSCGSSAMVRALLRWTFFPPSLWSNGCSGTNGMIRCTEERNATNGVK